LSKNQYARSGELTRARADKEGLKLWQRVMGNQHESCFRQAMDAVRPKADHMHEDNCGPKAIN
jgi:hypothetical protein